MQRERYLKVWPGGCALSASAECVGSVRVVPSLELTGQPHFVCSLWVGVHSVRLLSADCV